MILPHLGVGGAQRVAAILANHWAKKGLDLHFVTLLDRPDDFYSLDPKIQRYVVLKRSKESGAHDLNIRVEVPNESWIEQLRSNAEGYVLGCLAEKRSAGEGGSAVLFAVRSLDIKLSALLMLIILANFAVRHIRNSTIYIGKKASDYSINTISGRRTFGGLSRASLSLMRASFWRAKTLRTLIKKLEPDAVVSFLGATNILTVAATNGLPTHVVISERNDPARQELGSPWQDLRPIVYPLADVVTANSHGALESMESYCSKAQLAYVPNPIIVPETDDARRTNSILFLARLVHQKAPEILLEAFALFTKQYPQWTLQVAGDGPMEGQLRDQARDYGISNRVVFHGLVKDPTDIVAQSRIFVLPSRFEGTPNSLLEAMAARLACIVSDASPGPLRLVEHGTSGLVVKTDDPEDLAEALGRLAQDPRLCRKLGDAAFERTEEFRLENVVRNWEQLLFGAPLSNSIAS